MSEQNQRKASDNAAMLKGRIEELETLIANNELGGFSPQAKEISSLFQSLQLSHDGREYLWSRYQECWTIFKAKWEENTQVSQKNAEILSEELDALDALAEKNLYKDFWQKTKEISSLFKSFKLPRESREKCWQRFKDICGEVKAQREQLEAESESNKNRILSRISNASGAIRSAFYPEDFTKVRESLNEIMVMLKDTALIKPHRDECWDAYRKENGSLWEKREKKQWEDYGDLDLDIEVIRSTLGLKLRTAGLVMTAGLGLSDLAELTGDPHAALPLIKNAQQKLGSAFLSKDQRQELRKHLQELWDTALYYIELKKEAGKKKHEEWVSRQEERLEKLDGWINTNDEFIEKLENEIAGLEEKIQSSWNEDWAYKAHGWIVEKQAKISEVESKNQDLREQIDQINGKLNN